MIRAGRIDASPWDPDVGPAEARIGRLGANGERHYKEQIGITAGRIVVAGGQARRLKKQIPDFLLPFTRVLPLAVVEAKSGRRPAADGLQQAKGYARTPAFSSPTRPTGPR